MARRRALHRTTTRLRIALAQIDPVLGDLEANVARHLVWARRALARGAQLLVFPELSLTGYSLQDLVADVAVPLPKPQPIRALFEMSRRISMVVCLVGETPGHRYHNSAGFLSGGLACPEHRKVYPPAYGMV